MDELKPAIVWLAYAAGIVPTAAFFWWWERRWPTPSLGGRRLKWFDLFIVSGGIGILWVFWWSCGGLNECLDNRDHYRSRRHGGKA